MLHGSPLNSIHHIQLVSWNEEIMPLIKWSLTQHLPVMHLTDFQCLSLSLSYPMLEGFHYHIFPTQAQCRKLSDNTIHKLIYYFHQLPSHKGNRACKSPFFSLNISMSHLMPSTDINAIITSSCLFGQKALTVTWRSYAKCYTTVLYILWHLL